MSKSHVGCLLGISLLIAGGSVHATPTFEYPCPYNHWQPYAERHRDPFIGSIVKDMGLIVKNIFDWDTFKIVATSFPFLAMSRVVDEKLQNCFYDKRHHKNIRQLPDWTHKVADFFIYVPVGALSSLLIVGPTHDMRTAGRVFVAGLPFVWLGKDLIKQCKADINLRPWNEHYSCHHRAYGGFPSGHMAASIYMALFFGLRYGAKFAVPLGVCSACIGATYLSSNRHYLSQLVAGVAWGTLWAYAARKAVDHDLEKDYQFNFGINSQGRLEMQVAYRF
jgi:hypothetical protein